MEEAKVSNKGLASRMRAEATKAGLSISPDHVSVRRWLDGAQPHSEAIKCLATVLGAKLGRKVTPAEIGFDLEPTSAKNPPVDTGSEYPATPEEAVKHLDSLTSADLAGSTALAEARWTPATTPNVIASYLFAEPQRIEVATSLEDAGKDIASRIRSTIKYFMDLDFQFGGGHTRKMVLFYWKTEIVPALRQSYPESVRKHIFAAAADAAEVLGWSAYDDGRHGAGQSYFVQGLRLAREADDPMMGGQILANLSHQANYLGNFSDAIQYARAAQAATTRKTTPAITAMLLAMEARALASIGDARACAEVLHRAEKALDQQKSGEDPHWINYFDRFELAGEAAHCFRDLGKVAEAERFVAQAIDPDHTPPRTRAFIDMVNAATRLNAGDLEHAVSIATQAIHLAEGLQSSRHLRYVADFYSSLLKIDASHSSVRDFTELVRGAHPQLIIPSQVRTDASLGRETLEVSASEADIPQQSRATQRRSA